MNCRHPHDFFRHSFLFYPHPILFSFLPLLHVTLPFSPVPPLDHLIPQFTLSALSLTLIVSFDFHGFHIYSKFCTYI